MELKIKLFGTKLYHKQKVIVDNVNGKLSLTNYTETTEEYSISFGNNGKIVKLLGLPPEETINNGKFRVKETWVSLLQPYFKSKIDIKNYKYQIEFIYRKFT